jgi:hypothetical protein
MVESAAHLVDHVFPEEPVRQLVLTFPFPLRLLLAAEPRVLSEVLAVVQRGISTFLIRRSGHTVVSGARTGAVTLIQRFGSALNLNPHLHMLFLDGVYTFRGSRAVFHRARRPQRDDIFRLLHSLSGRIVRLLERRGLLIADPECPALDFEAGSSLDHLHAASIESRIAIGPQAGRKALTLYTVPPLEDEPAPGLVASIGGFSLHAGTVCEPWQRSRLERLCRYITRPPVATKRLSVDVQGRVVYRYKRPFRDGSTHVVLEPLELMAHIPVRHPSGDLWSSKSAILPICHGQTGGPRSQAKAEPYSFSWSVRLKRLLLVPRTFATVEKSFLTIRGIVWTATSRWHRCPGPSALSGYSPSILRPARLAGASCGWPLLRILRPRH